MPSTSQNRIEEAHFEGARTVSEESSWSKAVAYGREWTRNEIMLNLNGPIT